MTFYFELDQKTKPTKRLKVAYIVAEAKALLMENSVWDTNTTHKLDGTPLRIPAYGCSFDLSRVVMNYRELLETIEDGTVIDENWCDQNGEKLMCSLYPEQKKTNRVPNNQNKEKKNGEHD